MRLEFEVERMPGSAGVAGTTAVGNSIGTDSGSETSTLDSFEQSL